MAVSYHQMFLDAEEQEKLQRKNAIAVNTAVGKSIVNSETNAARAEMYRKVFGLDDEKQVMVGSMPIPAEEYYEYEQWL